MRALEVECASEEQAKDWQSLGFIPFCKANELEALGDLKGIQAQIVAAKQDVSASQPWPYVISGVLLLLFALPWLWYFFCAEPVSFETQFLASEVITRTVSTHLIVCCCGRSAGVVQYQPLAVLARRRARRWASQVASLLFP
jgi:hypothetical protein